MSTAVIRARLSFLLFSFMHILQAAAERWLGNAENSAGDRLIAAGTLHGCAHQKRDRLIDRRQGTNRLEHVLSPRSDRGRTFADDFPEMIEIQFCVALRNRIVHHGTKLADISGEIIRLQQMKRLDRGARPRSAERASRLFEKTFEQERDIVLPLAKGGEMNMVRL